MEDKILNSRVWSTMELCGSAIEIAGMRLEPDDTKAYMQFKIGHAFTKTNRAVTGYGTTFHPGTVANSYQSLLHQNLNYGHKLRSYDKSKERKEIPRDYSMGSIVAVEYPQAPTLGWTVEVDGAPHIRGAAVIHKQLEKVSSVFGEHLTGKHNWSVSLELQFSLLQSGFIIGRPEDAKKKQAELLADTTPKEFQTIGLGYVPMEHAPESLLESYNFEKRRVAGDWEGLPVVLLKGGINGKAHFMGVGVVRYGAEREAEIQQILAADPDRLEELDADGVLAMKGYFESFADLARHCAEG
jgi:hypothetical protein